MATPQAKIESQEPKVKTKRASYLPVRVLPEMRYNFFISIDGDWTDKDFDRLVQLNSEMRLERTAEGVIEIMPPPKGDTGAKDGRITAQLINGAKLGWLIDPIERKVYVYRPNSEVEVLHDPETVSGDPVLPGFRLDLERRSSIW